MHYFDRTFSDFPKFINFLVKNLRFLLFWITIFTTAPCPLQKNNNNNNNRKINTDFKTVLTDPS